MLVNNNRAYFLPCLMLSVCLLAWYIQHSLFINWDVAYLLHTVKLLLKGGTYSHDFFAPNPPIILYLYLPPYLAHHVFHLNLVLVFRLYVFLLALLSWILCYSLAKKTFIPANTFLADIFMAVVGVVFLVLPSYDFGQRDHLLVIFSLPYFLLAAHRLISGENTLPTVLLIGLLSGLGFAIKPQFLVTPLLVELYYGIRQKNYLAWWRPEVIVMGLVLMLHILIILVFYPDYLSVVAPFVMRNYYNSIGYSWSALLWNNPVLFSCSAILFYLASVKTSLNNNINTILVLAFIGFLFSYVLQRTTFYYHLLPAFSLSLLLMSTLWGELALRPQLACRDVAGPLFFGLSMAAFLCWRIKALWAMPIFSPATFFSFVGLLFLILMMALKPSQSILKMILAILSILLIGNICFYLALRTSGFSSHYFGLTVFVLLSLFGLLNRDSRGLVPAIFLAVLGVTLFIYPVYFSYGLYWRSITYKEKVFEPLIAFMKTQPAHSSIEVLSRQGNYGSPLFQYVGSSLEQRFDCLWPTAGFVKQAQAGQTLSQQYVHDKNFYLDLVADELYRRKPSLVLVDRQFDHLRFFSQNEKFREAWKSYRYLTRLKNHSYYDLDVYRRLN